MNHLFSQKGKYDWNGEAPFSEQSYFTAVTLTDGFDLFSIICNDEIFFIESSTLTEPALNSRVGMNKIR